VLAGETRTAAARFSFLMSIPVILGSGLMSVIDITRVSATPDLLPLAAAFVCAFITGIAAIRFMLKIVRRRLWGFSAYLVLLAALTFIVL
jgi:undecaprenyl-diphosphatase